MLVLSRKVGERILIGDDIHLVVMKSTGGRVQVGIDAPQDIPIRRSEVSLQRRKQALPITRSSKIPRAHRSDRDCCACTKAG